MKNAKVEGKKIPQPRRVAGVPVRSGVKAGVHKRGTDRDPRQRMTSPLERGL